MRPSAAALSLVLHATPAPPRPPCSPPCSFSPLVLSPSFPTPAISLPTLFSPKLLARISLPPPHLVLWPSALPCPLPALLTSLYVSLALQSLPLAHCPSPTPRLSGASPPPVFGLGIHRPPATSFFLLTCICNRRCDAPACLARTPCLAPTRAHCHTFTVIHSLRAPLPLCQSVARPSKILTLPVPYLASLRYAARRAHKNASS